MSADPLRALLAVVQVLDQLGLRYAIGGSVASSVHGEPRASADADLLVELPAGQVGALVAELEDAFYVSPDAATEAARRHASFNVIHLDTMYKVDLFVAGSSTLDQEQLKRRQRLELTTQPSSSAYVTAAENIILRKLDWYRLGGGVSDQQWRDVLGILKVQGQRLDRDYMIKIAASQGLADLLDKALGEADVE